MYNTMILDLLIMLSSATTTPTGYSAGLFGGAYFAQSYFGDAWGGLETLATALYTLQLLGVG